MYINNEDFEIWMQKLSKKLSEIGQDLKSLINTKEVFDPFFFVSLPKTRVYLKRIYSLHPYNNTPSLTVAIYQNI